MPISKRAVVFALLFGFVTEFSFCIQAQLPVIRLNTIFPPGGRVGTTFEISVTGADLDDANQFYFSTAGITAKPKVVAATGKSEANKFLVTIATNTAPGVYEARVVGFFGISNARAFVVGDLTEIIEPTTNNVAESAAELALGTVANGRGTASAVDFFKFPAKPGQRVLIDCQTKAIDSKMDAVLILYDGSGKELARNRRGGLLDFTAAAEDHFILKVHDFLFRGGEDYFYRLTVSTGPYIDYIFPPSGAPGTKSQFVLYGRNLPGGTPAQDLSIEGKPLDQLTVEIEVPSDPVAQRSLSTSALVKPSDSVIDGFEFRLHTPQGVSTPVLLGFATGPIMPEQEPNNKPDAAQRISMPCEVVGQFYPADDQDYFTFEAKKGDVLWAELFSHRLGLPTDPFLLIQRVTKNDQGEEKISDAQELFDSDTNIGGVEFNTASRDPSGRIEVKEDSTYRIQVRDLFNRSQANPRLVYRLSIRKETPDFRLVAQASAPAPAIKDAKVANAWTPFLRRGETQPIKVMAFRRDGFNAEIQLAVEGLPPGVNFAPAKIEAGKNSALVMVTANDNAESWMGPVKIVGQANVGETELARAARGGAVVWNVGDYNNEAVVARMTRDFTLAVSGSETTPVTIEAREQNLWETSVAGKLQIPLKVTRRAEFNANLKLKAVGLSAIEALKELEVDGKATNATLELDLTQVKLPAGTHSFALQTQTQGKYRSTSPTAKADEVAAKEAEEALKPIEKKASELADAARKADEAKQAASKTAKESDTKAMQAAEAATAAIKAAGEADAGFKAANERLLAANAALEKDPTKEELMTAKEAALKAVGDAASKAKPAAEAKVAIEKVAAEAATKAKEALEASAAAEKAETEASAKAKEAEKKKTEAANRAKDAKQKVQPRDVTATFYSTPIQLKLAAAPITVSAPVTAGELKQGAILEITVALVRLYNFDDAVEFNLMAPKNSQGLSASKLIIPKDQSEAKLILQAANDATPGEHKMMLQASLKLNNQSLQVEQTVVVKVIALEPAKNQ